MLKLTSALLIGGLVLSGVNPQSAGLENLVASSSASSSQVNQQRNEAYREFRRNVRDKEGSLMPTQLHKYEILLAKMKQEGPGFNTDSVDISVEIGRQLEDEYKAMIKSYGIETDSVQPGIFTFDGSDREC